MDKNSSKERNSKNDTATQMSSSCGSFTSTGKAQNSSTGDINQVPRSMSEHFDQVSNLGNHKRRSGSIEIPTVNKPIAVSRKLSHPTGPYQWDSNAPRRLSQLFLPPNQEELQEVDQDSESSRLLGGAGDKREAPVIVSGSGNEQQKPIGSTSKPIGSTSKPSSSASNTTNSTTKPSSNASKPTSSISKPTITVSKPASNSLKVPNNTSKQVGGSSKTPLKLICTKTAAKRKSDDELDKLSILDKIEDGKGESDFSASESTSDQESASEDEGEKDPEEPDPSWNDTICSNRSAYFKHYYQKNLSPRTEFANQASSQQSLASLIKSKTSMAAKESAEAKRKKRKENIGLTFLVIFLFLVLVVGISLIYHFYNLHLLELSLFKKLKFQEEGRLLHLYNLDGKLDIDAKLGTTLGLYTKPEDCTQYLHYLMNRLDHEKVANDLNISENKTANDIVLKLKRSFTEFQFDEETVCLDWANEARIQIHRTSAVEFNVNCYDVFWSAQHPGFPLQDCINLSSPENGVWWGIGDIANGIYPLESLRNLQSSLFITAELDKYPWGRILSRTFISSHGGMLMLPEHLPASISVSGEELCIAVNVSHQIDKTIPLMLNYTVCAAPNISSAIHYVNYLWEEENNITEASKDLNHSFNKERILERIENPTWIPFANPEHARLTQDSILEYADKILANNESTWGHILLPISWQRKTGEYMFDPHKFPSPKNFTKALRRKGFELALTISPLVSTDTRAFKNGTTEGLWVLQKESSLPALIQYNTVVSGALIDFTNVRAVEWFISKMQHIKNVYGIDRFHLDPPDSYSIPMYHEFNTHTLNPDLALKPFINAVATVSPPISTEGALSPPPFPTFVTVGTEESGWKSLASLIPRILSLTMLGYNLIDAGIVGGNPGRPGNIPDDELYIRWAQAAAFLPAFQMNALPNFYEADTQSIVFKIFEIRRTIVLPRLKEHLDKTLRNNTPLIFPLGLLYPDDTEALYIKDEWIIGDDLLVAPVMEEDQTSRDIYIPDGLWESQLDGRLKRGPGWIYNYKVPLTDVAYFIKKLYSRLSRS